MRRYRFLEKEGIYEALNRLRNAFLAARNGTEVEMIINGLLTSDERLKIGRRIIVAEYLREGFTVEEIIRLLKVGKNMIQHVSRLLDKNQDWFDLIKRRSEIVEKEYKSKKFNMVGGPKLVFKRKEYSGFSRKDIKRK